MYENVCKIATSVSNEAIECRRLKKITKKYSEDLLKFEEAVVLLEHHITIAYLIT